MEIAIAIAVAGVALVAVTIVATIRIARSDGYRQVPTHRNVC